MFLTRPASTKIPPATINSLFQGSASLDVLSTTDLWSLDSALIYKTNAEITITIPKGVITDLASIPKILDWVPVLDINGTSRLAGVLHDALYKIGREKGKDFCDQTLREALISLGMGAKSAATYYYGVHWFGASAWSTDGKNLNYGPPAVSNFVSKEDFDAWGGAPIYSQRNL
jgi:hypothetical protein